MFMKLLKGSRMELMRQSLFGGTALTLHQIGKHINITTPRRHERGLVADVEIKAK